MLTLLLCGAASERERERERERTTGECRISMFDLLSCHPHLSLLLWSIDKRASSILLAVPNGSDVVLGCARWW
jgi:hypothetical protein